MIGAFKARMVGADGITAPLRHATFRRIWLASVLSNLGILIQGVGAAWAMTQMASSADKVGTRADGAQPAGNADRDACRRDRRHVRPAHRSAGGTRYRARRCHGPGDPAVARPRPAHSAAGALL